MPSTDSVSQATKKQAAPNMPLPSYFSTLHRSPCWNSISSSSTPSPSYSDIESEDIEYSMALAPREDCSATMTKVLDYLDQVVEHLRDKGENEAANIMAKKTYDMVEAFNNGTAAWDIDTFLMGPRVLRQSLSDTAKAYDAPRAQSTSSWATIAATPTPENNKIVKYRPSDAVKRSVDQQSTPPSSEDGEDMRVVWIMPWDKNKPLSRVTEQVHHGPLLSMVYDPNNNAVCIIFQHGSHAANFLEDNADCVTKHGRSLFGLQHNVVAGDPYPKDHQLSLMEHPTNERRRLTFARSQLFVGNMSELQFKRDIAARVGEHNIELIWLFNSGNATVVFTGTVVARTIRDEFRRLAKTSGPYKDVTVSFSHDPCERPMNLITQIPQNGGSYHSTSPNSNRHSPPGWRSRSHGHGNAGSRPSPSNVVHGKGNGGDGWTTVKRR